MKKAVIDTNVFVSGIFWTGHSYEILKAWQNSKIQLFTSLDILAEYESVALELNHKYSDIDIIPIIDLVKNRIINHCLTASLAGCKTSTKTVHI